MDFYEVLDQLIALLRSRGRVTYRALKRQFDLDDDFLEDLKAELIDAQRVAVDEDGRILVWTGASEGSPPLAPQPDAIGPRLVIEHDQPTQAEPSRSEPPTLDAERRQLTVMFCDLVGSTPLSEQLDPEDLREVVRAYQQTCAEVVQRFDGYIAQLLGDALLVYFSWPQAHEDDAQRAVRAGLGMLDAMGRLNARLEQGKGIRLAIRVGIHTGLVVVGEMGGGGHREQLALGETPNVAARLQGLAEPDTMVVSEATLRLIEGYFLLKDLGVHTLKGVAAPMTVHQVLGETGTQTRFDVAARRGLTPLVGRGDDIALLQRCWVQSWNGHGQVVLISGEGGIGKSRLVEGVREQVRGEGNPCLTFRCSPYHTNSVLYPVIAHMQRLIQWQRHEPPEIRLDKLEQVLRTYGFDLEQVVPLLAALLAMSLLDRYAPLSLAPQRQRHKTLETLVSWLLAEAARQPVLVVWEDLHWADPSTLELLSLLIDQVPSTHMLNLLTFRPEFRPPWAMAAHLRHLTLDRFTSQLVERMATHVGGGKRLPAAVVQQIITQSDGVPLFVEEVTKSLLESGLLQETEAQYTLSGPLPTLAIPATLHDALMARLDRLGEAKAVAQLAAALGRTFSYELLQAIASQDEATLAHHLERLVAAGLLLQHGFPPEATYTFKHALIQDAAYHSLLKRRRLQVHGRIAQVLTVHFPETVETQPEWLAHHCTEAGLTEAAVGYWHQAGLRAHQQSAYAEAFAHVTRGLEVVETLPEGPLRSRHELALLVMLRQPLAVTKGYGAPVLEQVNVRVRALCQHVDEPGLVRQALAGLWTFYSVRDMAVAYELAEQVYTLASRLQTPGYLLWGHVMVAEILVFRGEFCRVLEHVEACGRLYDPQQHRPQVTRSQQDPRVTNLRDAALALWHLGYPDQALQHANDAVALAQDLDHPYTLTWALHGASRMHRLRRAFQQAFEWSERSLALATEGGFALFAIQGELMRAWMLIERGQVDQGMAQMHQALSVLRDTGSRSNLSFWLSLLAEVYGRIGQANDGLHLIAEALEVVERSGIRMSEAELHRSKGALLLQQPVPDAEQAEACFQHALDIARQQQAKSWELRAAISLSRLWKAEGKIQQAHDLLAPVYAWFTEGFDTADVQEAKRLLEELAEGGMSPGRTCPPGA